MRRLRCCLGDAMEMNSNLPKSWDHKSLSLIDRSMDKDLITPSFRVGRDGDSKVVIVQTARAGRIHSFRYPPIQIIVDAERMERSLTDIPNISQKGTRLGNWLTREQAKDLLTVPERSTLKGKRDYVILARLVGCALRRNELAELDVETMQQREGRWGLADLEGKGRRIRTVAIPIWVKQGINAWMTAAGIEDGRCCVRSQKAGRSIATH
jgi:integrase